MSEWVPGVSERVRGESEPMRCQCGCHETIAGVSGCDETIAGVRDHAGVKVGVMRL